MDKEARTFIVIALFVVGMMLGALIWGLIDEGLIRSGDYVIPLANCKVLGSTPTGPDVQFELLCTR